MIIAKIIILYFIHIRHTDDFPSTGTRLVRIMIQARKCQSLHRWLFRFLALSQFTITIGVSTNKHNSNTRRVVITLVSCLIRKSMISLSD